MIAVTLPDNVRREFPAATRFLTEDLFNNLCLHDKADNLLAVFAADQWISVEVVSDGQT